MKSSSAVQFSSVNTCHNFYLEEAIGQQEGFHLHLPPFHDVSPLVLDAWEGVLEDRFIAYFFEQWWELLMRRPEEEEGRNFSLLIEFLKDKQHFGGRTIIFQKFSLQDKWNIIVVLSLGR